MPGQPVPGQPVPGQPMPGRPFAAPAYPGQPPAYGAMPPGAAPYGAPGYPMAAPMAAPPARKKDTWVIIGIIILVLLIVGTLIGFHVFSGSQNNPNKPVPAGQATSAQAAVRGYLQALAAGNSADALAFLATTPSDTSLLTDAVLAAGNAINPISNIDVQSANSTSYYVSASYSIGTQNVNANYYTTQYGKYYKLENATGHAFLPFTGAGVPLQVNGVDVKTSMLSELTLFPGSYVVTTSNSLLTVTDGTFVVTDSIHSADNMSMSIDLVSDAQTQFQAAAKTALDGCMAEQATLTSCGFGFAKPTDTGVPIDVDTSTIAWSFTSGSSDDFSTTAFKYDQYSDGLSAYADIMIDVRIDLKATDGTPYYTKDTLLEADIDFTDPANLAVTFQDEGSY